MKCDPFFILEINFKLIWSFKLNGGLIVFGKFSLDLLLWLLLGDNLLFLWPKKKM